MRHGIFRRNESHRFVEIVCLAICLWVSIPVCAWAADALMPGEIIVSERQFIFRVDPQTGERTHQYDTGGNLAGMAIDASGNIIVGDVGGTIFRVNPATGAQAVISTGGLNANDVALEATGRILVTDGLAWTISRVDPLTGAQTVLSSGGNLVNPVGVAVDAAGNIIVAAQGQNFAQGAIVRVDPTTGAQTVISSGGNLSAPTGVAFEADGHIIVGDQNATGQFHGAVIRVNPVTGENEIISSGGNFQTATGVAVEADGNIIVGNQLGGGLVRVDPVTGAQTVLPSGGVFVAVVAPPVAPPNTVAASPVTVFPDTRASLTFSNVSSAGNTTLTTSSTGPTPPAGFSLGAPPTYYDITTTATFTTPVKVCIKYDPAQLSDPDPGNVHLLHFENNGWVDVTTSNDTTNRVICGQVTSFSVFAIAQPVFFLHGSGGTANPPILSLDNDAPTAATAKYKDSSSVNFSGGNPWKEVGTWTASSAVTDGPLAGLSKLRVWLGLKNSDDQGTQFDLRAEVRKNGSVVTSGQTLCIMGVTRNPSQAKAVILSFDPFTSVAFDGVADVLSLKILTRIGTNQGGTKCAGHSNAVGLRLYFDAVSRNARFGTTP